MVDGFTAPSDCFDTLKTSCCIGFPVSFSTLSSLKRYWSSLASVLYSVTSNLFDFLCQMNSTFKRKNNLRCCLIFNMMGILLWGFCSGCLQQTKGRTSCGERFRLIPRCYGPFVICSLVTETENGSPIVIGNSIVTSQHPVFHLCFLCYTLSV